MATKRQAPDDEVATRSKRPRYTNPNKPTNLSGKKSFKKAHPVNDLKSQIRSLKRLLERESLPANIRVEKERALKTATRDLENAEKAKKKSEIIGRWHKVRFFDRQKAERRLKKARKVFRQAVDNDGDADRVKELQKMVDECEVDVNYAQYYPLERDYVPLFPSKRKSKDGEDEEPEDKGGEVVREGDKEMWELVRKCMKDRILQDLREGRLLQAEGAEADAEGIAEKALKESTRKSGKGKAKQNEEDHEDLREDGDDDKGAGFFE